MKTNLSHSYNPKLILHLSPRLFQSWSVLTYFYVL